MGSRAVNLLLSGHDHDLFINFNEQVAGVESSYDAHYVAAVDVAIDVKVEDGRRRTTWWPQFRVIDTATVAPDPEVAALVAEYERDLGRELQAPLATTAVELDSREATVRAREAAIGDVIADAMRVAVNADAAVMNGGSIRGGKIYPAGSAISRRDVLEQLPFGNRVVAVEIGGRGLRQAIENGFQVEHPDHWLARPDPWEVARPRETVQVPIGCSFHLENGVLRAVPGQKMRFPGHAGKFSRGPPVAAGDYFLKVS